VLGGAIQNAAGIGCVPLWKTVIPIMCVIPVVWYTISMAIYVRGTYRQTQLFYWLSIGRFTTCFGPIPGPSSGCITLYLLCFSNVHPLLTNSIGGCWVKFVNLPGTRTTPSQDNRSNCKLIKKYYIPKNTPTSTAKNFRCGPKVGHGLLILEVYRSHTKTHHTR